MYSDYDIVNGISITSQTLIGYNNCFSMKLEDGREVKIVNFYLETLKDLEIAYPIKVLVDPRNDKIGYICDGRIQKEKYRTNICEVCCPRKLLPMNQQINYLTRFENGDIIEKNDLKNDLVFVIGRYGPE